VGIDKYHLNISKKWQIPNLLLFAIFYVSLIFTFSSCGTNDGKFHLKGSFKGFNQGELYIFGLNGGHKIDTIAVVRGEFHYQTKLDDSVVFVMVFPNFSELPIYGTPKATVQIEGDASHLKEARIIGTEENEEMTTFRVKTSQEPLPLFLKSVAQFIKDNPTSPFCHYLLSKYFIQVQKPDYLQAAELAGIIHKGNPGDKWAKTLQTQLLGLSKVRDNGKLPAFTATDINGKVIKSSDLKAKVNVIAVWASWNYESQNLHRQLMAAKRLYRDDNDLKIVSISVDATVKECRKYLERDTINWSQVCDGKMWENPLLHNLGLLYLPDNLVLDDKGTIIAHSLSSRDLYKKISDLLSQSQ